jgi:uncharacterized membrane protein YccC
VQAQATLADGAVHSQTGKVFLALLDEAERIRLSFIALTRLRQNLAVDTAPLTSSAIDLTQIRQATAEELRRIARELVPERSITRLTNLTYLSSHNRNNRHSQPLQQMKQSLNELRHQISLSGEDETMRQMLTYYDMLRDQLHSAKKLAKSWKHTRNTQKHLSVQANFPRQSHLRIHDAAAILRANLTLRSVAFRHAIRLGVTLALATALYRDLPLLLQRGYWIPLSALLVLKPDFTTTFARGAARSLGTILGAVLTTLLLSSLAPTKELLVILDAVMAYIAFSVLFVNYALFSAFITMEVVFLLTFVMPQPLLTSVDRAVDTAIGAILALLIYAIWPTWERSQVPGNLADRLEALRHYFVAVMEAYANPANFNDFAIQSRRMESRLGRSNADASVGRSLQEPEPHRFDPDLAQGLLASADSISRSVLSLEAYLMDNPARHALPGISAFSSSVDEALRLLALALREGQPLMVFPDLQQAMHKLEHAGSLSKHNEARADLRFVIAEARRIIRNINTMKQLLSTKKEEK